MSSSTLEIFSGYYIKRTELMRLEEPYENWSRMSISVHKNRMAAGDG